MLDITVYTQPGCGPCKATTRAMDKLGVDYTSIDVTTDAVAADHLSTEGWQGTPVVEVARGDKTVAAWRGFRPDAIKALGSPAVDIGAYDKRGAEGHGQDR